MGKELIRVKQGKYQGKDAEKGNPVEFCYKEEQKKEAETRGSWEHKEELLKVGETPAHLCPGTEGPAERRKQ